MRTFALAALALLIAAFALPDSAFVALAQAGTTTTTTQGPKALFLAIQHPNSVSPSTTTATLAQWSGSFTDNTKQPISFVMVGSDPSKTNTTTTIPVMIVPIKMVFGPSNGNMTFDPLTVKLSNGQTLMQNVLASPLFTSTVKYVQGGTNVGQTQYIDAYQRANFWNAVSKNTRYHVMLGKPTILPEQTIVVSGTNGGVITNPFGSKPAGWMYVNDFDTAIQGFLAKLTQINPGVLPLFVSYDTYLTEDPAGVACCIGGYHSALGAPPVGQTPTNAQTYAYTTYEDEEPSASNPDGSFSQDISAMSHEIGEWLDDPFIDNSVNCADNNIMENGDPLENNPKYGTWPYTVGGFTYHPQSLVFIDYFGAPPVTDLHSWYSFQNDEPGPCPGQNVAVTPPSGNLPLGL